jgi:hypothetical protein
MTVHVRREFITLLSGAATAWPVAVRAQGVPRLGLLMNGSPTEPMTWSYSTAFQTALGDFGSVDGRDLHIDHRRTAGEAERARANAASRVGARPDRCSFHNQFGGPPTGEPRHRNRVRAGTAPCSLKGDSRCSRTHTS